MSSNFMSSKAVTQDDPQLNTKKLIVKLEEKERHQNSFNLNSYLASKALYESLSNQIKRARFSLLIFFFKVIN